MFDLGIWDWLLHALMVGWLAAGTPVLHGEEFVYTTSPQNNQIIQE